MRSKSEEVTAGRRFWVDVRITSKFVANQLGIAKGGRRRRRVLVHDAAVFFNYVAKTAHDSINKLAPQVVGFLRVLFPDDWERHPKKMLREFLEALRLAGGLGPGRDESEDNRRIRALAAEYRKEEKRVDWGAIAHEICGPEYDHAPRHVQGAFRNSMKQRDREQRRQRAKNKPSQSPLGVGK